MLRREIAGTPGTGGLAVSSRGPLFNKAASGRRSSGRAVSVWLIALLVALVATIQIRSEAEVERSLVGIDTTSLAFLIDDLHRANDSLLAESVDLAQRKATLESGGSGAADQVLSDEAKH